MRPLLVIVLALVCTAAAGRRLLQQAGPDLPLRPDKPVSNALPPVLIDAPLAQSSCVLITPLPNSAPH
jgi:hypothetical protein